MLIDGKRILVTGGTGSLGQRIVYRLLSGELGIPKTIYVFSRDEAKQHYMRLSYLQRRASTDEVIYRNCDKVLRFIVGDVRDFSSVVQATLTSDIIIHAAALKQVPTCEYFPIQAVQTNVLGAYNVVRAVRENRTPVKVVIGISTDKACQPINVMGMTKALQERIFIEANVDFPATRFACVRYGNVLASRGSVIPLMLEQIRSGGPVTITVKGMTRFLMPLDQAVDTVFAALASAKPGETYIPHAAAARMVDVASTLINGRDVRIVFIGIRPGEKIHEILVSEQECCRTILRGSYYVICPMLPELQNGSLRRTMTREYCSGDVTADGQTLIQLLSPYMKASFEGEHYGQDTVIREVCA